MGGAARRLLGGAAVGAQPGELPIYISRRTPTVTTLSAEWQQAVQKVASFSTVQWDQQKIVAVTTLDELIERFGLPVFCKIDVEGYEYEVLRGLSQPIRTLSFEYVPAALATSLDCIKRISQLGNYSFNWSPGERHQLQQDAWLTAAQMTELLTSMRPDDDSGDVYARRVNPA